MAGEKRADMRAERPEAFVVVVAGADGSTQTVDRRTRLPVENYSDLITEILDNNGHTRMVDRYTGQTIAHHDKFIVEYIHDDATTIIIDRLAGREVEGYNDYFVEYSRSDFGTSLVDRNTGEVAVFNEMGYELIVHFYSAAKGDRYIHRETYTELDPKYIDVRVSIHDDEGKQPRILPLPIPSDTGGVRRSHWIQKNKLHEDDIKTKLQDAFTKQKEWLELAKKQIQPKESEATKWWVGVSRNSEDGYNFKPKVGPRNHIWLNKESVFCQTLADVDRELIAFQKAVRQDDYFEPIIPNETSEQYFIARMNFQIWLANFSPTDIYESLSYKKLKWWEFDKKSRLYRFRPKKGAVGYVWARCGSEVYNSKADLIRGIKQFVERVQKGDYSSPRMPKASSQP